MLKSMVNILSKSNENLKFLVNLNSDLYFMLTILTDRIKVEAVS